MRERAIEKSLAMAISLVLTVLPLWTYDQAESANATNGVVDAAPMSAQELRNLVSPIALYPDRLVAQMLAAATFPDQVAVANYWLQENKDLTGKNLMEAVNKQTWDASVKALTQFPAVLSNMAKNLTWTSTLGEAYHNQAAEVMAAIQALRAQAKAEGKLKSGPQITVEQQSPSIIAIEPTNPEVVYVPYYNPSLVYGTSYVAPGYTVADAGLGAWLGFGSGVALGALASGGCCGWGWGSWNANWNGGTVVYNHNNFYGNAAWHGGYYKGYGNYDANLRAANNYRGYANRAQDLDRDKGLDDNRALTNSWAHSDDAFRHSSAFSGFDNRLGDHGGWQSRADSFRGWGSMHSGGFLGGRFGGGGFGGFGGRFGGGGFHGGGFRR
jgi:hypothetical protein